jgi:hypothetical protein
VRKIIIYVLTLILITGCISQKRIITSNKYVSSKYPLKMTFPYIYKIVEESNGDFVINASPIARSQGPLQDSGSTIYYQSPMSNFAISIDSSNINLENFKQIKKNHFHSYFYFNYEVIEEKEDIIDNQPAVLKYYKSKFLQKLLKKTNTYKLKGIKAYVRYKSFNYCIEYQAAEEIFDEFQFYSILQSIKFEQYKIN